MRIESATRRPLQLVTHLGAILLLAALCTLAALLALYAGPLSVSRAASPPKPYLYLLAGTPVDNAPETFPVTLYAVGLGGRLETVREIYSKDQGLIDVREDLEGRLYIIGGTRMTVIHERDPGSVDSVKVSTGLAFSSWGVVDPPGHGSKFVFPEWCNDHCWKIFTVAGSRSVTPRVSKGDWSLYRWFRYRGAPVTPWFDMVPIPEGKIIGRQIVVPNTEWGSGEAAVGPTPASLPSSVGAHVVTIEDSTGTHHITVRDVAIVADTAHFFAFAALPFYSKKWPVPVYVQNKTTGRWRVIDSPFIELRPRVFGSWIATTVEEPNPTGRESPGVKNERSVDLPADVTARRFPDIKLLYGGKKTYMPGKLLLQNLVDGRKITIDTGQQDSEVLDVRKDGLVLYRVNDEIFSAKIEGDKLGPSKLVVKGEDVPEVHWVFWSAAKPPGPAAQPSSKR